MNTVSLDISQDMLKIGQQRLEPRAKLAAGDFEALPFSDRVFDGAICLSALHHVPNIPQALREIQRVLKDDTAVVLSEPGLGHAAHPQSKAEMEELGVLERDIIATELLDECQRAGFQYTSVRPFLFPPLSYNRQTWYSMQEASQPTTIFSAKALWQVIAEVAHFGSSNRRLLWKRLVSAIPLVKHLRIGQSAALGHPRAVSSARNQKGPTEALLCWQSLITLRDAVEIHPVVVACKGQHRPDSRRPSILNAEIAIGRSPARVSPGTPFTIQVKVKNAGDTLWLSQPTHLGGFVALGAKLVDDSKLIVIDDYGRGILSHDVSPGETVVVEIALPAPDKPGRYQVKLDMVDECIAWFEHQGSKPAFVPLEVCHDA